MHSYLISGAAVGVAADLAPGPMLALVVAQTLRHGWREGVKVSLAPLLSDLPIVTITLLLLVRLRDMGILLAGLSVAGGLDLVWLGAGLIRRPDPAVDLRWQPRSVMKGVTVNFLNPHVYLFWMTVGGPVMMEATSAGAAAPAAFAGSFYVCLCGSKIALAVITGRVRDLGGRRGYDVALRLAGLVLGGFGGWFFGVGLARLGSGWWPGW